MTSYLSPERRFGTYNKFGTSNKFGASGSFNSLAWGVEVDWDGDGVFSGANESAYLMGDRQSISIDRGKKKYLRPNGQGFETMQTGRAQLVLYNGAGRYDAWNSSSPLYPNVDVGKDVKITVRDLTGSTIYPVFYGVISDIVPSGYGSDATVTLYLEDGWAYLRNYTARVAIQSAITPDAAIGKILDYISWPTRWGRSLDTSSDSIAYWWASGNKQAGSEIEDLTTSFLGQFYISNTGQAVFMKRSNTTFSGINLTQSLLLKDIGNPQPWEIRRNVTRIKVHPRTTSSPASTLYQLLGNTPLVSDGAANALTMFCNYTYNNQSVPASVIVAPVATTDYTMNTASDGSGTDKTAQCSVSATNLGDVAAVTITNSSGGDVYVTKLNIRGTAVYEQNSSDLVYPSTLPAQPREFVLDLIWQQDLNTASDFKNTIGAYLAALHPTPIGTIENRPSYQFALDISNIVTLDMPKLGLSGVSYRIGGIEHRGTPQSMITRFYLEPYISASNYWIWDTYSNFDTQTVFSF